MKFKSYAERAEYAGSPLAQKLLKLMSEKETNLAFSADVTQQEELLELCERIGPHICVLKTHLDILNDLDASIFDKLTTLSERYGFLILEDRKFADIGSTVQSQYRDGYLKIASWSDLVTVHGLAGKGCVQALKEVGLPLQRGALLLAEMSSSGNLLNEDYTASILKMGLEDRDFVIGFIAQKRLLETPDFLYFTPGIGKADAKDTLGQNYKDPRLAVLNGSDVVIVGRHIYKSQDPLASALEYRKLAWDAYLERLS